MLAAHSTVMRNTIALELFESPPASVSKVFLIKTIQSMWFLCYKDRLSSNAQLPRLADFYGLKVNVELYWLQLLFILNLRCIQTVERVLFVNVISPRPKEYTVFVIKPNWKTSLHLTKVKFSLPTIADLKLAFHTGHVEIESILSRISPLTVHIFR